MSIFDRFFPGNRARPEAAVAPLVEALGRLAPAFEEREVDAALVRARLADRCRDADVDPLEPSAFDAATRDLDVEAWRRLALVAAASEHEGVRAAVDAALQQRGAAAVVTGGLVATARERALLDMSVLRRSPLRLEELARALLARGDIAVAGESKEQSARALERLDYGRLLAQAEQAREAARQRMEYLKKAQEAEDKSRDPRRGKW